MRRVRAVLVGMGVAGLAAGTWPAEAADVGSTREWMTDVCAHWWANNATGFEEWHLCVTAENVADELGRVHTTHAHAHAYHETCVVVDENCQWSEVARYGRGLAMDPTAFTYDSEGWITGIHGLIFAGGDPGAAGESCRVDVTIVRDDSDVWNRFDNYEESAAYVTPIGSVMWQQDSRRYHSAVVTGSVCDWADPSSRPSGSASRNLWGHSESVVHATLP